MTYMIELERETDGRRTAEMSDLAMTSFGIVHTFAIDEGNHTNRVLERIEMKVLLSFFSSNLSFTRPKQ